MAFFLEDADYMKENEQAVELESGSCEHLWEYFDAKVDEKLPGGKRAMFDKLICLNDPNAVLAMQEGSIGYKSVILKFVPCHEEKINQLDKCVPYDEFSLNL